MKKGAVVKYFTELRFRFVTQAWCDPSRLPLISSITTGYAA